MQPLSSGKSQSDINLLQMTLKKVHRSSYIPQKKSGSKPVSTNDSGVLGAWKNFSNIQAFCEFRNVLEDFGSVRHKLPEEAWDKFRRLNKVPDKFLQHAAIVVGNYLTCLFCVFLVFEKFCLLAVFSCYSCFLIMSTKRGVFFCCASSLSFSSIATCFHPNWFFCRFRPSVFVVRLLDDALILFNELDHRPQNCVLKSCFSDVLFQIGSMQTKHDVGVELTRWHATPRVVLAWS